jgi:hypothetical protein
MSEGSRGCSGDRSPTPRSYSSIFFSASSSKKRTISTFFLPVLAAGSVVDALLIDLKHWLQEEFGIYLNSSTTLPRISKQQQVLIESPICSLLLLSL